MEYRKETLKKMLDRAQELSIRGLEDEDLIYDMVIDELGDFRAKLVAFENKTVKTAKAKRKTMLTAIFAAGFVLLLTCAYLITSFALGDAWGKTWLIMVGGIFAGICAASVFGAVKLYTKKKYAPARALIALTIVLVTVFVYLFIEILTPLQKGWLAFLVMVIALLGVDTALAFVTKSKIRFVELAAFMEVFSVLLYVILGLTALAPWHPTWILCLAGVLAIIVEVILLVHRRNKAKNESEDKKINKKYVMTDEDYYTKWDD
jgi:hypothetical protein